MQITFKLYAMLTDYLPVEQRRRGNEITLDLAPNSTVVDVIAQFNLPPKMVHLVLTNGPSVPPSDRAQRTLQAGDVLAVWPPIAGG